MTKDEFIEAHWEDALVIDAKMQEAAKVCVKNFLGEEQDVSTLINREHWAKYDSPLDYFVPLAYAYSLRALDQRILRSRSFIETLIQLVILRSTIGNECVTVVARSDYSKFSIRKALLGNKATGLDRQQSGIEQVRMIVSLFHALPATYEEMNENSKFVPRKSAAGLWSTLWRKGKTEAQRADLKDKEADDIRAEIARICDVWNMNQESSMNMKGWMLLEFDAQVS